MIFFDEIPVGTTSYLIEVMLRDSTTGAGKTGIAAAGVTAKYIRQGGSAYTAVGSLDGTMSLGTWKTAGWAEVGDGLYQFGVPNAAVVTGANGVTFTFAATGVIPQDLRVVLTGATNYRGATLPADIQTIKTQTVTCSGGVTIPAATLAQTGDTMKVSVGTGAGQLNVASGKVPATLVSTDVSGNVAVDLQTIKTQAVTAASGVTFPASIGTSTYAGGDTSGTTTLLTRISGNLTIASGKVAATLASTDVTGNLPVDLQTIKTQTVTAAAPVTFPTSLGTSTYAGGDTSGTTTLLTRIGGNLTIASGKVAATLASTDVTGNLPVDLQTIKTQTVTAAAGVTFPAAIGTSVYAGGAVASVTGDVGGKLLGGGASTITGLGANVNTTQVGGVAASVYAGAPLAANITQVNGSAFTNVPAVVNAYATGQDPASAVLDIAASSHNTAGTIGAKINSGGSGSVTVGGYATGQDPATLVLDATGSGHNTAGTIGAKINSGGSGGSVSIAAGGITQASYASGVYVPANLLQWNSSTLPNFAAKVPATLAAADVTGNLPVDVQTIQTQAVTAAAPVTFPAAIGTSTYTGGAVASVTGAVGSVTGDVGGKLLGGGSSTITGTGVQIGNVTLASGTHTGAVIPTVTAVTNAVTVTGKPAVTLSASDVSGNVAADLQTIKTQAVTAAAPVTFPATVGSSVYAGADTSGTATLLSRLTPTRAGYLDNIALAPPTLAQIDTQLSGTHGSGAWGGGGGGGFTLAQIATAVWTDTTSGDFAATGSPGKSLMTNLDTTVSSRSTYAGADTSGITTLLNRIASPITISSGKVAATVGAGDSADAAALRTTVGIAGGGLTNLGDARLAALDAAVSSRSTYAGADTSGTTMLLSRLTPTRAGNLDNLAAAAPTAAQIDTLLSTTHGGGAWGGGGGGGGGSFTLDQFAEAVLTNTTHLDVVGSPGYLIANNLDKKVSLPVTVTGKPAVTLAAADITGNVPIDLTPVMSRLGVPVLSSMSADLASLTSSIMASDKLSLAGTVVSVTNASSFVIGFATAVAAGDVIGLQVCFTSTDHAPAKRTISQAVQIDSRSIAVATATSFSAAPAPGDSVMVI